MSAFLSHKFKLIYPHVPRTGGTSLSEVVERHLGGTDITDGQLEKHQSLHALRLAHPKEFAQYTKFAIVRHPLDRIASLHHGFKPRCSFETMIDVLFSWGSKYNIERYAFYWPCKRWLCSMNGNNLADKVFRLEDGLDAVCEYLRGFGIPIEDMPHLNASEQETANPKCHDELRESVSQDTYAKLYELYKWDFETFNYK